MDAESQAFPARVGRYRVLGPLGVGGMASVYLAASEGAAGFSREVALKVLHPHLLADDQLVQQFLTEARVAAKIRHPNVVPVTDVVQERSQAFLVMELVEGATLSEVRRIAAKDGVDLPFRIWARWVADALAGLHAAHELADASGAPLGLVHRDFSPQNILIGRDGSARLSDFGIVKLTGGDAMTKSGVVKGKVHYMAPEQVRGDSLDRRCDVWAAGVLLWELATRRRLRSSKDDVQVLLEIVAGDPPRASSVGPVEPPGLDDVIASALVSDREHRCPSAAELRARLTEAAGPGGVADASECAAWLSAHVQAFFDDRQKKLEALRASPGDAGQSSASDAQPALTPAGDASSTDAEPTVGASLARSMPDAASSGRRTPLWAWALGAVALLGLLAGIVQLGARPPRRASAPSEGPPAASSAALIAAAPELPVHVTLIANARIVALSVDGRSVPVASPGNQIELDLPEFARGRREVLLEATAEGGRKSSLLWKGEGRAEFEFEAQKPSPRPSAAKPAAPGKSPLAKNPYGK